MKFRVSKKDIRDNYHNIVSVGYCALQHLLDSVNPRTYSCGNAGWSCDYYEFDGVLISTGYGPIGKQLDYDFVREYDKKAEKLRHDQDSGSWDEYKNAVKPLLTEFIEKVKEQIKEV